MGVGDHWRKADARWRKRQAARAARESVKTELVNRMKSQIEQILQIAQSEDWSQREAARKAELSWGAFRRCHDGRADPAIWLPKVQEALNKVLAAKH